MGSKIDIRRPKDQLNDYLKQHAPLKASLNILSKRQQIILVQQKIITETDQIKRIIKNTNEYQLITYLTNNQDIYKFWRQMEKPEKLASYAIQYKKLTPQWQHELLYGDNNTLRQQLYTECILPHQKVAKYALVNAERTRDLLSSNYYIDQKLTQQIYNKYGLEIFRNIDNPCLLTLHKQIIQQAQDYPDILVRLIHGGNIVDIKKELKKHNNWTRAVRKQIKQAQIPWQDYTHQQLERQKRYQHRHSKKQTKRIPGGPIYGFYTHSYQNLTKAIRKAEKGTLLATLQDVDIAETVKWVIENAPNETEHQIIDAWLEILRQYEPHRSLEYERQLLRNPSTKYATPEQLKKHNKNLKIEEIVDIIKQHPKLIPHLDKPQRTQLLSKQAIPAEYYQYFPIEELIDTFDNGLHARFMWG